MVVLRVLIDSIATRQALAEIPVSLWGVLTLSLLFNELHDRDLSYGVIGQCSISL